jgi:hypothetical protein
MKTKKKKTPKTTEKINTTDLSQEITNYVLDKYPKIPTEQFIDALDQISIALLKYHFEDDIQRSVMAMLVQNQHRFEQFQLLNTNYETK